MFLGVVIHQPWSPGRCSQELVETGSTYWHTIDFLWVLIFALLYVMRWEMKSGFDRRLLAVWLSLAAITLVQFGVESLPGHGIQSLGDGSPSAWWQSRSSRCDSSSMNSWNSVMPPRRLARLADLWVGATGVILLAVHFLGLAWSPP